MKKYEAVVIGAGPGGYETALDLGRAGIKTVLVDRGKGRLGGTCLNEGCTPAKNYLESAAFALKADHFKACGVELEFRGLDLKRLREKTLALENEIRSGVSWMLEQAGVESLYGTARFADAQSIEVDGETITFDKCIIATGSQVRELPALPLDGRRIISSREFFELERLPASVVILGGGPIGCEFATFFNAFGVEVTLISRSAQLLPSEDEDIAKALLRAFKKRNIRVVTSATVKKGEVTESGVELLLDSEESISCELVLCAVGRIPNTKGLQLENAAIAKDEKGYIGVNAALQTSQPHIYALGDCINTPAFAHTAYAEARVTAHNIINGDTSSNTRLTPSTIFTNPSVASCGLKEREAKKQGVAVEVRKAFFKVNTKAKIHGDDSGFAKIIVCSGSGVILGASVIGVEATEVIHELLLATEQKLTADELKSMIHAHPTVSEIISYL